jgi:hypothetical protein
MTAADRRILLLIREHLSDTIGNPSDDDCISFALRCAESKIKDIPKPRHPRTIK